MKVSQDQGDQIQHAAAWRG